MFVITFDGKVTHFQRGMQIGQLSGCRGERAAYHIFLLVLVFRILALLHLLR